VLVVDNQGIRIHYSLAGDGPPLVLQHGFYGSTADWWAYGYAEELKKTYRLIMIDARGHGASDKPHEPEAYDLSLRAADIVSVLDHLGLDRVNYLGYSMGGWIGFGMALYAPERIEALIIGGAQPYGNNFTNGRKMLAQGIDTWVSEISKWGPYSSEDLERVRENDVEALIAAFHDRSDISNVLTAMDMPCLLYAGSADEQAPAIAQYAAHLPNGRYLSIPGQSHIQTYLRGDLIVPHVKAFLGNQRTIRARDARS
jgi:pimeloyl-ACP methyl ester carboxylesterase